MNAADEARTNRPTNNDNVFLVSDSEAPGGERIKLLDFGLSRTRAHLQTFSGEIAGTLSYLAPEILEGKPASTAADLFAFGVLELLLVPSWQWAERRDGDGRPIVPRTCITGRYPRGRQDHPMSCSGSSFGC